MGRRRRCPGSSLLRDERGIALVMSLGIMLVLAISVTTVLGMTMSGTMNASLTNSRQKAYALAEAGVNNALSQIASHYPNTTSAGDPCSPTCTWIDNSHAPTYPGGTVSWSGSFNWSTSTWSVSGIGTVPNPTAGGAAVSRTATAQITVLTAPPPYTPFGLYSGDPNFDVTLSGGISVNVPVYVAGNLTLSGNTGGAVAKIWEANSPATVAVQVDKTLDLEGGNTVGTPGTPVKLISAACAVGGTTKTCSSANGFNAGTISNPRLAPNTMPTVDPQAVYNSANWAGATCSVGTNPFDNDGTRNNSKGTVNLMGLSYDCSVTDAKGQVHRLAWNSLTQQLTVQNSVFIDGSFASAPHDALQYSGNGSIFFDGTVDHKGTICGPGSSFSGGNCGDTWDPAQGSLLLVACDAASGAFIPGSTGFTVESQATLEAGAWSIGNFSSTGQAHLGGSVFVNKGSAAIAGGGVLHAFVSLPSGAPSTQIYTLANTASNYSGG